MKRLRFDSLFARLMLAQAVLLGLVGLLLTVWLTAARADASAIPYAALWAPDLARAAASPRGIDPPRFAAGVPVQSRFSRPPDPLSPNISRGPATGRLTAELRARGVAVDDIRIAWNSGQILLWFHVLPPGAMAVWLAVPMPPILPSLTFYTGSLGLLTAVLFTLVSWRFARRVARPLEHLRSRMVGDAPSVADATPVGTFAASPSSEIVAIDAAYRELIERLQRTERERVLLLAGVSHDLRSPLGRIRLAAELLPATPETQADVRAITRNVDHADRLIGSFLDFVRAGSLELDETVDVTAVAAAVVARFDLAAERLCLAPGHPGALVLPGANALLVDRLIFNLVDNALKHGSAPVRVSFASDAAGVQIDVCDSGSGLPDGQEQALLQAFARGDAGRATPGLGLGLSVVAQVTSRLHGRLQFFRDAVGHHARVTLPLP